MGIKKPAGYEGLAPQEREAEKQKGQELTSWGTLWRYAGRKVQIINQGVDQGIFQIPTSLKQDDRLNAVHLWSVGVQGNTPYLMEEDFNPSISSKKVILID